MKILLYIVGCFALILAVILPFTHTADKSVEVTSFEDQSIVSSDTVRSNLDSISGTDSSDLSNAVGSSTEQPSDTKEVTDSKTSKKATGETTNKTNSSTPVSSESVNSAQSSAPNTVHTHSWTNKTVAPTCTTDGYTLKVCSCGNTQKIDYVNATGHNWSEWTTVKQATATQNGLQSRTCFSCGKNEEKVTDKLPQTTEDFNMQILDLVNKERAKANLNPLEYYSAGQSAADIRAKEIQTKFSHTRPNGESCFTVLDELNIRYRSCGENIAYGYTTPEAVVEAWMNSEGHRKNILNANYTHLIVGVDNNNWVQLFLQF